MRRLASLAGTVLLFSFFGSSAAQTANLWQPLRFLEGTWEAKTGEGTAARVMGTYVFQEELGGHILARHSAASQCVAPQAFDCQHSDLLYLYQEAPGQTTKAIFFDNEGHVIHYTVATPDPTTAVFLSDAGSGPRFRLTYHLVGTELSGKFQMQMPGQDTWRSYLEWSGGRR